MHAGEPLEDLPAGPVESAGFLADGTWQAGIVRHEQVDLPGGLQAPQHARRAIEEHFASTVESAMLASVELLTTELVSNAVRHGGAGEQQIVVMHLALAPDCLRVEVCDPGVGFEPGPPKPYGEGGYGLFLVSEVSSRWGVSREDGNCTWFEIEL
ncbi:MAG: serine/threonine-protein kinase RsbW [Thermoleophilaceae bacterium]|jgi:anti-sigma regulatory factor (Ser/Thr protein kinase)|nr:serine/threonine-protein kinase RsbW [Thermoleophilaceae bacterium]MEA2470978.1 serine/threonine-protein kinase RsbW [Thermoleophilaceae bacterium]